MVQCSYCQALGHSLRTCSATGAEKEQEKRASDPKVIAQKAKAAAKRSERNQIEARRLQLTMDPKVLYTPEVFPGHIKEEFGEKATSISGAIDLAIPKAYLVKILKIINENRYCFSWIL
jgi:hypothetical protein